MTTVRKVFKIVCDFFIFSFLSFFKLSFVHIIFSKDGGVLIFICVNSPPKKDPNNYFGFYHSLYTECIKTN